MNCYSSDEPARGCLGDECQSHRFTETWSVELKTEDSLKRRLVKKRFVNIQAGCVVLAYMNYVRTRDSGMK